MSEENQVVQSQEVKNEAIEVNLSKQRKMYERQLEQERLARQQAEERTQLLKDLLKKNPEQLPQMLETIKKTMNLMSIVRNCVANLTTFKRT